LPKAEYRIRCFFDFGGSYFWSGNDAARKRFGYPISPENLPLSAATIRQINELIDLFQTSLNWEYPPDPGPWRQEECDRFNAAARQLFEIARLELGDEFELCYEQKNLAEDPDLDEYLIDPKGFRRKASQ
jgi:hypothetical protein